MLFDVIVHVIIVCDYCVSEFLLEEIRIKILHISFFVGHLVGQLRPIQTNRYQCLFLRVNQIVCTCCIDAFGFF
jgi:flagellar biosynthesis regulator FlaF